MVKKSDLRKNRVRILLITARSDIGGGPLFTLDYAKSISEQKDVYDDVYVASPLDLPHGPPLAAVGRAHFALPHRQFSFLVLLSLAQFIRQNQILVVHSHGRGAGIYSRLLGLLLGRHGVKVIHSYHGIHHEPTLMGHFKFWVDRFLQYFTDEFVFVSQSEYRDAICSGFRIKGEPKICYPLAPPCWLDYPKSYLSPIRIGALSRIDYQKGIDLLLQGLVTLRERFPALNWTFTLAGGGSGVNEVKIPESIADRAKWIGPTAQPIEYLKGLDIYVAHSRWESFNISVIEALSQGLPLLISNVPGHEYFIEQGVAQGFKLGDMIEFSDRLAALIQAPKPTPPFDWIEKNHRKMRVF